MDKSVPVRNRANTLVQEEAKPKIESEVRKIEPKIVQGEKVGKNDFEEDIIIKCGLDEMVKRFFKEYVIVWYDANVNSEENKQYIVQLEKFCKVFTFTEWKKASVYLATAKVACHVLTSGTNGEFLVKEIYLSQSVTEIYIFCGNPDYHLTWAKNYQKVSSVETKIQNVLDQIRQNLLKWYKKESSLKNNLPAFASIFNDWDKSGINNLHHYLKVIPNFSNRLQAKNDFLSLSRAIYSDKTNLSFIEDFEKNYNEYNKEAILKWYTQESFVLKVTNNCLRIANSDSIQYCRLLLKDLERAIKEQYKKKSQKFNGLLYRGASLSHEEWLNLKANLNGEVEMHGFLSASKDKSQALKFLQIDSSKNIFITILVPGGPNDEEQGFAEVEEFSRFPQEKEVLFNVRSRFTVLEADDKFSENLSYRHLVLLYGAQGFRKFLTEKNATQEIIIPNIKSISCSVCNGSISEKSEKFFFKQVSGLSMENFSCRTCLPDVLKVKKNPLLCIPLTINKNGQMTQIKITGVVMASSVEMKLPMYGYKCCRCQANKQEMYYKCIYCWSETKRMWCGNCIEGSLECMSKGHHLILESNPFSFWCDKMSQKELEHLKFQSEILQRSETFQQGDMYVKSHEYQKAIEYFRIFIEQNKGKGKDLVLVLAYYNLAYVYKSQAEHKKALEYYFRALEILIPCDKNNHPDIAHALFEIGKTHIFLGAPNQPFEMKKQILNEHHPDLANIYCGIGDTYNQLGGQSKALEYYLKALEIQKQVFHDNYPDIAESYSRIGEVHFRLGKFEKALDYYSKSAEIFKSVFHENHLSVATSYIGMGRALDSLGEGLMALEYYEKSLAIKRSLKGENHPEIATIYSNIGVAYNRQGKYNSALEYYGKALDISKRIHRGSHPDIAACWCNMAGAYSRQAEYKKALEYFDKALNLYEENHPAQPQLRTGIGRTHFFLGDQNTALKYYFEALAMKQTQIPENENHPDIAWIHCNIGNAYNDLGELNKALESLSKSLTMQKIVYQDKDHSMVAESYSGIGRVHLSLKEYKKALENHMMSLEMRKSVLHEDHPDVATSYYDIADVFKSKGDYMEAQENYSKALEIRKLVFGEDHIFVKAVSEKIQALPRTEGTEGKSA